MINITEKAVLELKKAIEEHAEPGLFVRIGIKGGGCSGYQHVLTLEDDKGDKDQVYEIGGLEVVIDRASSLYLEGTTLDFVDDDLIHRGFKFSSSAIKNKCGCGSSFSM